MIMMPKSSPIPLKSANAGIKASKSISADRAVPSKCKITTKKIPSQTSIQLLPSQMKPPRSGEGDGTPIKRSGKTKSAKNDSEKVRWTAFPLAKQRFGYLWEKKIFTDVVFVVGKDQCKIEAHRLILAAASEMFQQLLFNEEAQPMMHDEKYLLFEDEFSESAFEVFVKAMYTNEVPICLTLSSALQVFYLAKKYKVYFLEDLILEHMRQLLTVTNVFEALRLSTNAVELTYLAPICWKIIEEQTNSVLEYHIDDLDAYKFSKVLERDRLSMDEVELFQMAVKWAANLCKNQGLKTTGKNKRHFMEPLLKHFRFTTMTSTDFSEVVAPSRILDVKETQQIQNTFTKWSDPKLASSLPYKTLPRVNTSLAQLSEENGMAMPTQSREYVREIPKICSDSAVIAPNLSSKLHTRKGGNTPRKLKRTTGKRYKKVES